jgi:hypothetical protein
MRLDLGGIRPTPIAQWPGLGEPGSKMFPNFQITNDIFFNPYPTTVPYMALRVLEQAT